tara:strand:+ start:1045 stop:1284 length:240 start_codon:yes stop_codon:yes gene_type:complete
MHSTYLYADVTFEKDGATAFGVVQTNTGNVNELINEIYAVSQESDVNNLSIIKAWSESNGESCDITWKLTELLNKKIKE